LLVALLGGVGTIVVGAVSIFAAVKLVPPLHPSQVRAELGDDSLETREELETLRQLLLELRLELSDSRREASLLRHEVVRRESPRTNELRKRQQRERRESGSVGERDESLVAGFSVESLALSQ
jgi:hypothetical protein